MTQLNVLVRLPNGDVVNAPAKGVLVFCGQCAHRWVGGRRRRSCPSCGASINQHWPVA